MVVNDNCSEVFDIEQELIKVKVIVQLSAGSCDLIYGFVR